MTFSASQSRALQAEAHSCHRSLTARILSTSVDGRLRRMSASTASSSKRSSLTGKRQSVAAPKPPLTLSSRAVIASHASITGTHPVTISPYCVLNPYSRLISVSAPVVIGEGCIVWEKGSVGIQDGSLDNAPNVSPVSEESLSQGVSLGRNVVVESMAVVEALEVGEGTVIESGAKVGIGCIIGKHCTITAYTSLPPYTRLPDFTVVMSGLRKRINTTLIEKRELLIMKNVNHERQLESLKALIPNNLAKWQ